MNKKDIKNYAKEHLKEYVLEVTKVSKAKGMYNCPLCGSGTRKGGTGAFSIDKDGKSWKCFSCGKGGDTLDLIGYMNNTTDFNEEIRIASNIFNLDVTEEVNHNTTKTTPSRETSIKADNTKDAEETITKAQQGLDKVGYRPALERGLSKYTAQHFKLGYIENWKHPNALDNPKVETSPRLIVPTGKDSYLARDTRQDLNEVQEQYKKLKVGSAGLFNIEVLSKDTPVFIVEGEIDAISIYEAGADAIALGSISRVSTLLEHLKTNKPKKPLLLALDNDDRGKEATNKLATGLKKLSIEYFIVDIVGEYKDPNEACIKNIDQLRTNIQEALKIKPKAEEEYINSAVYNYLGNFLDGVKESANTTYIPTGFNTLDYTLDGGLYEGLYTVGAISSLGKTTLITQMADNIAKGGNDVLIFSLEMSTNELIAKSLSRLTLDLALYNSIDTKNAKTVRGITTGSRYKNYNQQEKQLIVDAVKKYQEYAKRIYIVEGMGDVGVLDIKEAVERHKSYTGNTPVVIVDYLQILAPYNDRATDKQNMDKAVIELRRIARDYKTPVIAISSLNRTSYSDAVGMEAFKESGAIEYSSDVLIGLQLKGTGSKDFNPTEEKKKDPRNVELVILKNRNGKVGDKINLDYYPMFNTFKESK